MVIPCTCEISLLLSFLTLHDPKKCVGTVRSGHHGCTFSPSTVVTADPLTVSGGGSRSCTIIHLKMEAIKGSMIGSQASFGKNRMKDWQKDQKILMSEFVDFFGPENKNWALIHI